MAEDRQQAAVDGVATPATDEEVAAAHELLAFVQECPSMFHTAAAIARRLDAAGFTRLNEGDAWTVAPGSRCYVVRNASSIIAFRVGEDALDPERFHFQLTAAHGDSPTFKVKHVPALDGPEGSLRLDVEAYGGMIDYTWFRPAPLACRPCAGAGGRARGEPSCGARGACGDHPQPRHSSRPRHEQQFCPQPCHGPLSARLGWSARRGRYRTPGGPGCRCRAWAGSRTRPLLGEQTTAVRVGRGAGVCLLTAARRPHVCVHLVQGVFGCREPLRGDRVLLLRQRRGGLQHQAGRHVHAACRRAAAPHGIAWPHTRALPPRGGKVHACELRQRPCGAS